jgi:tetratricopeptide (TPR) repeat protein
MRIKFLYKILFSALFLLSACTKQLDLLDPQSLDSKEALNTPEAVKSAVIGAYGLFGSFGLYGGDYQIISDLLANDSEVTWLGTFFNYRDVWLKQMVADNSLVSNTWIQSYNAINATNNILKAIDIITDPAERNLVKGEALLIRGVCYFELVRLFAQPFDAAGTNTGLGVPIVLEPNDFSEVERATIAEVYAQIITDLTEAESLLPESNGTRANTYTVSGFLSRVYLQQGNYAQALAKANRIIQSGDYQLNPAVETVFNTNNTAESIFEVQQNAQNNAGQTNSGLATFYADFDGTGRGDIVIRNEFVNLYEANDLRRQNLFYIGFERGQNSSAKWSSPIKNYPIMRIAEMYLTRAEANLRLGSSTGDTPLNDVNRIRTRAGLSALVSVDLAETLLQRRLELAFEGHRLHEVKRLKLSVGSFPFNHPKLVCPIPRREMNVNKKLVQNDTY